MPVTKANNWTMGRPIRFTATLRAGKGTGSRNLYSLDDVYLMAMAYECSKAGMAAKAIGKVDGGGEGEVSKWVGSVETLFVSRGPKLAYRIETSAGRVRADAVVRFVIELKAFRTAIDRQVARLR